MAEYIDRTLVFARESAASLAYHESATNPIVARIARMATTTTSSAMVKAEKAPAALLTSNRDTFLEKSTACMVADDKLRFYENDRTNAAKNKRDQSVRTRRNEKLEIKYGELPILINIRNEMNGNNLHPP